MIEKRLVDTNVIIRYLLQDNPRHFKQAEALFSACDKGEIMLVLLPEIMTECVFVLESFYRYPRFAIASALNGIAGSAGVIFADYARYQKAFQYYTRTALHFVDCVLLTRANDENLTIATFDKALQKHAALAH